MNYFLIIAALTLNFMILSQSYNLVLGYTGMVHVGHVAFRAIGAYTSALLMISGAPFSISLLSGVVAAALAGFILGLPTVRFKEDYLVAATLGMGEIIRIVLLNEREFTGGSTGLPKIPRPEFFGISFEHNGSMLLLTLFFTVLTLLFVRRLVKSPFGRVLESIREDEVAAKSLGKNTSLIKLQILIIAAMLAGLSGALYAHTIQFIDPEEFNIHSMIFVFLIVVFGGAGTFWGPVVGTAILFILFEAIRFLPFPGHILGSLRWMLFAVILMVVIIFKPKGIMGSQLHRKKL